MDIFKKIGGLSPENERILLGSIKKKSFPPKTILQKKGKVSNKIYIVERGIVRTVGFPKTRTVINSILSCSHISGQDIKNYVYNII